MGKKSEFTKNGLNCLGRTGFKEGGRWKVYGSFLTTPNVQHPRFLTFLSFLSSRSSWRWKDCRRHLPLLLQRMVKHQPPNRSRNLGISLRLNTREVQRKKRFSTVKTLENSEIKWVRVIDLSSPSAFLFIDDERSFRIVKWVLTLTTSLFLSFMFFSITCRKIRFQKRNKQVRSDRKDLNCLPSDDSSPSHPLLHCILTRFSYHCIS